MSAIAHSRAGRPKDTAKRAAIVAAATRLFAGQPFDMVKMEEVAAAAGVSKMTVYSHFKDKETLFEMVVSTFSEGMMLALADPRPAEGALQPRLNGIGEAFLRMLISPETTGLCHSLTGALRANRSLGRRFYDAGPGRAQAALAAALATAVARGELTVDDPVHAADDLLSLWEGGLGAQIAFGVAGAITEAEVRRRAARGTALFLKAHQG